jgi:hypothetical protein
MLKQIYRSVVISNAQTREISFPSTICTQLPPSVVQPSFPSRSCSCYPSLNPRPSIHIVRLFSLAATSGLCAVDSMLRLSQVSLIRVAPSNNAPLSFAPLPYAPSHMLPFICSLPICFHSMHLPIKTKVKQKIKQIEEK